MSGWAMSTEPALKNSLNRFLLVRRSDPRDGCRGPLPDARVAFGILRDGRFFEEQEAIGFEQSCDLECRGGIEQGVGVVHEEHVVANGFSDGVVFSIDCFELFSRDPGALALGD